MKCEDVSNELMAYIDGQVKSDARRAIEEHLAGCVACRTRADEFRRVWTVLDEAPAIEPSFGFDARLRRRMAAEPRRPRFFSFMPQPRLAVSFALLAALAVLVVKLPLGNPIVHPASAMVQQQDFNAINNLGVLENYDVVTKLGALSDLAPTAADDSQPPVSDIQDQQAGGGGGA